MGLYPCLLRISARVSASTLSSSITRTMVSSDSVVIGLPRSVAKDHAKRIPSELDAIRHFKRKTNGCISHAISLTKSIRYAICGNNPVFTPGISQLVRSHLKGGSPEVTHLPRCSVSSDISCIVIKSDRRSKKTPLSGEVVRVAERDGLFVVMHVDPDRRVAQLMERGGKHRLVDVPFASLRTFNRSLAQEIHRFLDAREEAQERERGAPNHNNRLHK